MFDIDTPVVHMQGGPNHEDEHGIVRIQGRRHTTVELEDGTLLTVPPQHLRLDDARGVA